MTTKGIRAELSRYCFGCSHRDRGSGRLPVFGLTLLSKLSHDWKQLNEKRCHCRCYYLHLIRIQLNSFVHFALISSRLIGFIRSFCIRFVFVLDSFHSRFVSSFVRFIFVSFPSSQTRPHSSFQLLYTCCTLVCLDQLCACRTTSFTIAC